MNNTNTPTQNEPTLSLIAGLEREKEKLLSEMAEIEAFEDKYGSVSRPMQTRFNHLSEAVASFSDAIHYLKTK